eukprot:3773836-Pleurochrysis_carterae.AAC.2
MRIAVLSGDNKSASSACEECADDEDTAAVGDADDRATVQGDEGNYELAGASCAKKLWSKALFPE